MNRERYVYLSGKTVRWLLKRFENSNAIGLEGIRVKAFVPERKVISKPIKVEFYAKNGEKIAFKGYKTKLI